MRFKLDQLSPEFLAKNAAALKAQGVNVSVPVGMAKAQSVKPVEQPASETAMPTEAEAEPKYRSKLEREFHWVLRERHPGSWIEHEPIKLKLARGAWFTPDYCVTTRPALIFYEVKGFWREAARVRIKVAARLYPWAKFIAVRKRKKKDGGGWEEELFTP